MSTPSTSTNLPGAFIYLNGQKIGRIYFLGSRSHQNKKRFTAYFAVYINHEFDKYTSDSLQKRSLEVLLELQVKDDPVYLVHKTNIEGTTIHVPTGYVRHQADRLSEQFQYWHKYWQNRAEIGVVDDNDFMSLDLKGKILDTARLITAMNAAEDGLTVEEAQSGMYFETCHRCGCRYWAEDGCDCWYEN